MKTITHCIGSNHITNGCSFISFETAQLTFDVGLLCELRSGIVAAKVLRAHGVSADIRLPYAEPDTDMDDFEGESYNFAFECAIVSGSNWLVFRYTVCNNPSDWFELVVDIDQFEMLEQEMRLGLDAAEAMPTQGGIQHGPSPAQLSERKQASV
jgi:hypothetical protein